MTKIYVTFIDANFFNSSYLLSFISFVYQDKLCHSLQWNSAIGNPRYNELPDIMNKMSCPPDSAFQALYKSKGKKTMTGYFAPKL